MKRIIISLVLIFSFAAVFLAVGNSEVNAKAKPTVLCISAKYCGACQEFDPIFKAAKSKFSDKFKFEKEYFSQSKRAQSLHVTETPTVFILDGNNTQRISWGCLSQPSCFEGTLKNY